MSQYVTPYRIDEASGTDSSKHQTVSTNNSSVATNEIIARRILITTGSATTFIKFGSAPTAAATDYVVPANSQMIFNFKSGNKVAVFTGTQSYTSIVDLD